MQCKKWHANGMSCMLAVTSLQHTHWEDYINKKCSVDTVRTPHLHIRIHSLSLRLILSKEYCQANNIKDSFFIYGHSSELFFTIPRLPCTTPWHMNCKSCIHGKKNLKTRKLHYKLH